MKTVFGSKTSNSFQTFEGSQEVSPNLRGKDSFPVTI